AGSADRRAKWERERYCDLSRRAYRNDPDAQVTERRVFMPAPLSVLHFAWLRERGGVPEETITPPDSVTTVADLAPSLRGREHRPTGRLTRPKCRGRNALTSNSEGQPSAWQEFLCNPTISMSPLKSPG